MSFLFLTSYAGVQLLNKTHEMLRTKLPVGESELPMLVSNILEAASTTMTVYLSLVEAATATTEIAAISTETTETTTSQTSKPCRKTTDGSRATVCYDRALRMALRLIQLTSSSSSSSSSSSCSTFSSSSSSTTTSHHLFADADIAIPEVINNPATASACFLLIHVLCCCRQG